MHVNDVAEGISAGRAVEPQVDVMVGGVEKGGTTSLAHYLSQHTQVISHLSRDRVAERIEFSVFVDGRSEQPAEYRRAFLQHFGRIPEENEVVLAKSVGILHLPEAGERLRRHNPRCRLVFSLRDPVERAYSAYWYQRWRGAEDAETFEDALAQERRRARKGIWAPDRMYVGKGEYDRHLKRLGEMFSPDQIHVVILEDLAREPMGTVARIFKFLGLECQRIRNLDRKNPGKQPRSQWFAQLVQKDSELKALVRRLIPKKVRERLYWRLRRLNSVESERPPMKESTRQLLRDYFRPHTERLEVLLGRDLSGWYGTGTSG